MKIKTVLLVLLFATSSTSLADWAPLISGFITGVQHSEGIQSSGNSYKATPPSSGYSYKVEITNKDPNWVNPVDRWTQPINPAPVDECANIPHIENQFAKQRGRDFTQTNKPACMPPKVTPMVIRGAINNNIKSNSLEETNKTTSSNNIDDFLNNFIQNEYISNVAPVIYNSGNVNQLMGADELSDELEDIRRQQERALRRQADEFQKALNRQREEFSRQRDLDRLQKRYKDYQKNW
jgi:hypothetical protein